MFVDFSGMRLMPELRRLPFIDLLRLHFDDLTRREGLICSGVKDGHSLNDIAHAIGVHKGTISKQWRSLRKRHPKIVDFLN